jgi:cell wall-associated NlpC family hydrolase
LACDETTGTAPRSKLRSCDAERRDTSSLVFTAHSDRGLGFPTAVVVKRVGLALCAVAVGPLVLVAPVAIALSGGAAVCPGSHAQAVDSAAVAEQVQKVLVGGAGADVSVASPGLDSPAEQIPNAKTIQATGMAMRIPVRGQVVALATALQESGLRNLSYGDRDSVGLFQQRPSQGWGSAQQLMDPVFASTKFYEALREVDGWESLTVTQAAQAVQRSAYPDAYAKWEPLATALQRALAEVLPAVDTDFSGGDAPRAAPGAGASGGGCEEVGVAGSGVIPGGALPKGYAIPPDASAQVRTAIRWALAQLGTPYQWGGTCGDPHGPDPMGRCDCSSLMQAAYKAAGIELSRTTYTQVGEGRPAAVDSLRPGDLLFTRGTAARPEHVGMFIGAGLVVHAPRTRDVVKVDTLAEWRPHILAVRRMV